MQRKPSRSNILRRLAELETRFTDCSGLVPHSPGWMEFWTHQFHLRDAGQECMLFPLEFIRAWVQSSPPDGEDTSEYEDDYQAASPN
jgi:hypothetical protein